MSNQTHFDDWSDLKSCNDCEHYYTNLCDGVTNGVEAPCSSFKVIRGVDIPQKLERLTRACTRLKRQALTLAVIGNILAVIALLVTMYTVLGG